MDKPLISVILPVYNVEKYLSECMTSLFDQTYENLEFVMVDDGSTNKECSKMCDEFLKSEWSIDETINALLDDVQYEIMRIAIKKEIGDE